jgi:hypothetical protein
MRYFRLLCLRTSGSSVILASLLCRLLGRLFGRLSLLFSTLGYLGPFRLYPFARTYDLRLYVEATATAARLVPRCGWSICGEEMVVVL